jgi:hypothetical protein
MMSGPLRNMISVRIRQVQKPHFNLATNRSPRHQFAKHAFTENTARHAFSAAAPEVHAESICINTDDGKRKLRRFDICRRWCWQISF